MKLTSCKHWLKHIARIHCTVCLTCTDYCMKFIYKQDNLTVTLLYFIKNGFKPFLKFTSILGTCNKGSHIKGKHSLVFKSVRNIASYNSLCKSFNNGCFTYTGFTYKYRIILSLSRKNSYHISNLIITAYYRIHFLFFCLFHKVHTVFFKGFISCFRIIRCY